MKRRVLRGALLGAAAIIVLALPAGSLYYEYNAGASCARCHEIRKNYDAWHASSHREVACGACHGEITTLDAGFHLGNLRRLVQHVRQGFNDPVRFPRSLATAAARTGGPAGDSVSELPSGASRRGVAAEGGSRNWKTGREIVRETGTAKAIGGVVRPAGTETFLRGIVADARDAGRDARRQD